MLSFGKASHQLLVTQTPTTVHDLKELALEFWIEERLSRLPAATASSSNLIKLVNRFIKNRC
jgi:hypothetical protein